MSPSCLTPENPAATAVLCVECQNGVLGTDPVFPGLASDNPDLVPTLQRLLDAARTTGARVMHATYEGALGGTQTGTALLWRMLSPATAGWAPGNNPTQVVPELLAPTDFVLPRHHGLFPTFGTELLPVLDNLGVTTIVLAGVSLNLALPATAAHITQSGFRLVVPRDAVGGTPRSYAQQVLDNSISLLGRLTTVDDVISEWAAPR
jgi:nicotinamidase-related amidase